MKEIIVWFTWYLHAPFEETQESPVGTRGSRLDIDVKVHIRDRLVLGSSDRVEYYFMSNMKIGTALDFVMLIVC